MPTSVLRSKFFWFSNSCFIQMWLHTSWITREAKNIGEHSKIWEAVFFHLEEPAVHWSSASLEEQCWPQSIAFTFFIYAKVYWCWKLFKRRVLQAATCHRLSVLKVRSLWIPFQCKISGLWSQRISLSVCLAEDRTTEMEFHARDCLNSIWWIPNQYRGLSLRICHPLGLSLCHG